MEIRKLAVGLAFVAAGVGTFAWNEGRYSSTKGALAEMAAAVVELGSIDKVDASSNGKVVHARGMVSLGANTVDPVFGVEGNVVSMTRTVEFYQWRERKHEETFKRADGSTAARTSYTYEKGWESRPVSHRSFNQNYAGSHVNVTYVDPPSDREIFSKNAKLGAYSLSEPILRGMGTENDIALFMNQDARLALARTMAEKHPGVTRHMAGLPSTADVSGAASLIASRLVHLTGSILYIGPNPEYPAIGDVRVTYRGVQPDEISLIATVDGSTLRPFKASDGREIVSVSQGPMSISEMTASQHKGNTGMAWFFRVVGALLAAMGAYFMTRKSR